MNFTLDPRLENDSVFVADWPLCQIRLSRNAAFPWLILIPRREDIVEIIDLSHADQTQLWQEIRKASTIMKKLYSPKKLNVANLGNIVAQLHVHVVARFEQDGAWPGPIWGSGITREHEAGMLAATVESLQAELAS